MGSAIVSSRRSDGIEIPDRAKYLRTIWMEMSRIHSHLLWLGLLADAMGFESLFMESWRMREKILDLFDKTTGGRIIHSINQIGGVQKDMTTPMLLDILHVIEDLTVELNDSGNILHDYTVQSRLKDVGILSREDAVTMGAVGPMLRASGTLRCPPAWICRL